MSIILYLAMNSIQRLIEIMLALNLAVPDFPRILFTCCNVAIRWLIIAQNHWELKMIIGPHVYNPTSLEIQWLNFIWYFTKLRQWSRTLVDQCQLLKALRSHRRCHMNRCSEKPLIHVGTVLDDHSRVSSCSFEIKRLGWGWLCLFTTELSYL